MQFKLFTVAALVSMVAAQGSTILNPHTTTATSTFQNVGNPSAQCNYPGCGTHARLSFAAPTEAPGVKLAALGLSAFGLAAVL